MRDMGGRKVRPSPLAGPARAAPALGGVVAVGPAEGARGGRGGGPHRSRRMPGGVLPARQGGAGQL